MHTNITTKTHTYIHTHKRIQTYRNKHKHTASFSNHHKPKLVEIRRYLAELIKLLNNIVE